MKYVYALLAPELGLIKIGCSDNPERRCRDLRSYYKTPLTLLAVGAGDFQDEAAYHERLADRRSDVVGFDSREWFRDCRKVRSAVKDIPIRGKLLEEEFAAFLAGPGAAFAKQRSRIENATADNVVTNSAA